MAHFQRTSPNFLPKCDNNSTSTPMRSANTHVKSLFTSTKSKQYTADRSQVHHNESNSKATKVKDNWSPYVQKEGDLFYVQVNDSPGPGHTRQPSQDRYHYHSESPNPAHRGSPSVEKHSESKHHENYRGISPNEKHVSYGNPPDGKNFYEKIGHNKYSHNLFGHQIEDQNSSKSSGYSESSPPHNELCNGDINHNSINRNVHLNNQGYDSDFYDKHSDVSVDRSSSDSSPNKPAKIKHVYITPNPYSCRNGENLSSIALCDKLFGITLYQYNHKQYKNSVELTVRDRKLLVQHVSLSSPAGRSQQIHRGDMLVGINDVTVTWENLEVVCYKLSSKVVKLSFQVPNVVGPKPSPPPPVNPQFALISPRPTIPPSPRPRHLRAGENLSHLVFGDSRHNHVEYLQGTSCCAMYLTLEGDSSADTESVKEDIVYQYPPGDSKLLEVRGLFLTLCGVLPEVAASSARSSTIVHQREKIHIAYQREGQDVLVIGLPADRVSKPCVEEFLHQIHHLILVLYGPLHGAFRDMKHRNQLDQLFSLSLHNIHEITQNAMLSSQSAKIFTELIPGPKALNFTDDTKLLCDEILSEFEASDFDDLMDSVSRDERREYSILGTCVFYKEYLLCNHLCQSDLHDTHLFLKHHCILKMLAKKSVEELVVWREVFPSQYCHQSQPCPQGYQHPQGRWFLLVVGMKHFILCTLLEAGGCSESQKGNPGPHPFYVSQAKATLLQFEADEVTMTQSIEHRLSKISKGPCLSCADSVIIGHKQKKDENIVITPHKSRFSSKNSHENDHDSKSSENSTPVMKRQGSKLSYGSNDSGESSSSANKVKIGLSKAASVFDITSAPQQVILAQGDDVSHIKFTRGIDNCLFHFVNINDIEGIFISPTQQEMSVVNGALQEVVLSHFYMSCLQIRNIFQQSMHNKKHNSDIPKKYGDDSSFKTVKEQGVLFSCIIPQHSENSKKQPPPLSLTYWAVGRMFPNEKEMYVCFHESVPQTTIEMAFKLDHGLALT